MEGAWILRVNRNPSTWAKPGHANLMAEANCPTVMVTLPDIFMEVDGMVSNVYPGGFHSKKR